MFGNSRRLSLFFPARLPAYARNVVVFVFCVDLLFILIHLIFHGAFYFGRVSALEAFGNFNITEDHSYPEWFNYTKLTFISAILFTIAIRTRTPLFLVLTFCFVYALLDDSLRLHERGGAMLVENLRLPAVAGMRGQDLGEFMIHVAAGLVAAAGLAIGWLGARAKYRRYAAAFLAMLFLLGFFAVLVDVFRRVIVPDSDQLARGVVGVIEDGGEMLATALTFWVALSVYFHVCGPPGEPASTRMDVAS